jgi:hypothetical protein
MPCCSYCGECNHNIRHCSHPSIINNYNDIKSIFQSSVNIDNFITVICRFYNSSILKVVSVKFAYSKASLNKKDHSLRLYNHFRNLSNLLTYTPDTLPSYAQDLNQIDESNDISWFIDRNPMRNIIDEMIPLYNDFINYENYIAAEDEFIPISRNLENEFNDVKKKYYITPIVSRFNNKNKKSKEICVLDNCPICYEPLKYEDIVTLNCNHEFCKTCIIQTLHYVKNSDPSCALCREKICSMLVPDVKTYDTVAEFCIL